MQSPTQRRKLGWPRNLITAIFKQDIPENIIRTEAESIIEQTLEQKPFYQRDKKLTLGAFKDCLSVHHASINANLSRTYAIARLKKIIRILQRPALAMEQKLLTQPLHPLKLDNKHPWVLTDDDCLQHRREIEPYDKSTFELCEIIQFPNKDSEQYFRVAHARVFIKDFSKEECRRILDAYQLDEDEVSNEILAECLFEYENIEYCESNEHPTFETAAQRIYEIIEND